MSETTTSAPAAPASAPAAVPSSDSGPVLGPPASSQPAISVSEAARLLNQQRRRDAGEPPAPANDRKPSANEVAAAAKDAAQAPQSAAQAPGTPPAKPAQTGLSAMERALGVPGVAPPAEAANTNDAGLAQYDIDGRRYSQTELREAVLKASDYTQKTQELAQQRLQLAAQQQALAQVLPYIQPELAKLAQTVQGAQKPDVSIMESDPQRYFRELAQYEALREEQGRLGGLTQLQQEAHQRALAQQVEAANEQLAKELPFWADPVERGKAQQEIVAWATSKGGFSRDELRGLADPRQLKAMMKAAMFDRWVEGAKTSAPAPQLQAPVRGTAPPPPATERASVAEQAFDQRPNVRNAAALLAARRANGGA